VSAGENRIFGRGLAPRRFDNSPDSREVRHDPVLRESSIGRLCDDFGPPSTSSFRHVALSAVDCALAHWYMVPGLKFQRSRVRLGLKSLWRGRLSASAVSLVLHKTPAPASYLGFHFASQFLASDSLGNYLDVSSPWLFPFTLLSSSQAVSATLLTVEAPRLHSLLSASSICLQGGIRCEAENIPLEDASYDTITSLWGPGGGVVHGGRNVRNLWRVLKPGGTLLLSVPCARKGAARFVEDGASLYDVEMLERDIFDVLGQPKRYAIYGAQRPSGGNGLASGDDADAAAGWGGSLAIGRDWRCYASLQELPGQGVIVMKFSRSEHKADTTRVAFTSRLA
jgi:SAM-dependent methyltransferase